MSRIDVVIRGAGVLVVAGVLATGAYVVTEGGGPDPGDANIWVDISGGTCTRSETPGDYVDAAACSTFQAAYNAASVGDTVRVKNGTYSPQSFLWATRKTEGAGCSMWPGVFGSAAEIDTSGCISFIGESVEGVILRSISAGTDALHIESPYVYVKDMTLENTADAEDVALSIGHSDTCDTTPTTHDVVVDGLDAPGFFIRGGTYRLTIRNSNFHDLDSEASKVWTCGTTSSAKVNRFLFEGNDMSYYHETDSSAHMEFIHWRPSINVVVRNNRFFNGSQYNIKWQADFDLRGEFENIDIVNNVFGASCKDLPGSACTPSESAFPSNEFTCQTANTGYVNVKFRFNSVEDRSSFDDNSGGTCNSWDIDVVGNYLGIAGTCAAALAKGVSFEENVGITCGTGDSAGALSFVDPTEPAWNYHTAGGSAAINAVPTSVTGGCPATDIDGASRPAGGICDAGSDEVE